MRRTGKQSDNSLLALGLFLGLAALILFGLTAGSQKPPVEKPAGEQVQPENEVKPLPNIAPTIVEAPNPLFGYEPRPNETRGFIRSLRNPFLSQASPDLMTARDKTPIFLYRSLYKAYAAKNGGRPWTVGKQGIGDCVSWGYKHAAEIHLAVLWENRESSEWREVASEAIYGGSRVEARGGRQAGYGDGSSGGAAAKWLSEAGGIIFRQPYPGFIDGRDKQIIDLSEYSAQRAKDWGNFGCGGRDDAGRLDGLAKENAIKSVAVCRTSEEAAAAISSGYPVAVCSGQGFTSTRDADGFCKAAGRWSHCMVFIGVRYEPKPGLLCLNSWGPDWVKGPKYPEDQPDGSFWVEEKTAAAMLSGEDSFSVSGAKGFPYRDLRHGDWVRIAPPARIGLESALVRGGSFVPLDSRKTADEFSLAP